MDEDQLLACYYLLNTSKSRKRERWVHELMAVREKEDFKILFPHLVKDPKKFFNYFRMSHETFEELLAAIEPSITKQDTNMRNCITAKEKLAVTLR
ncbi:hypothetical protein PGB90_003765 [Kerria lacca]